MRHLCASLVTTWTANSIDCLIELNQLRVNHQCHIDAPVWTQ